MGVRRGAEQLLRRSCPATAQQKTKATVCRKPVRIRHGPATVSRGAASCDATAGIGGKAGGQRRSASQETGTVVPIRTGSRSPGGGIWCTSSSISSCSRPTRRSRFFLAPPGDRTLLPEQPPAVEVGSAVRSSGDPLLRKNEYPS